MKLKTQDFNLEVTLDSGQVFGFSKSPESVYSMTISSVPMKLQQKNTVLSIESDSTKNILELVRNYFDLERNLGPIYEILRQDEHLAKTLPIYKGLRLIRQDHWEALACFIISSNNNVKRIQGIWRNLSQYFGQAATKCQRGQTPLAPPVFPAPGLIARSHERILRQLGLGYRAPFLLRTAQFIAVNPGSLNVIHEASYEEAKERVLAFPGIGPKVADCALLYGFQKYEAFPVDVWIDRVMRKLYFRNRRVSEDKIRAFAKKKWGKHAGYVQQYLFHGARTGVI